MQTPLTLTARFTFDHASGEDLERLKRNLGRCLELLYDSGLLTPDNMDASVVVDNWQVAEANPAQTPATAEQKLQ